MVEAIDVIYNALVTRWKREGKNASEIKRLWNVYVPTHLLPRLYGYELMPAPYAIAHMKIGLKLHETGYGFGSEERVRVYLTNALEPAQDFSGRLAFEVPALAHEAEAVNGVKRKQRFTAVIGNPPYAVTSVNSNPFIDLLMNDYKKHVRGEQGLVALSDDYLKFIRVSQAILDQSGYGVWGMITNHGYLKGVIHRGVRAEILRQFRFLYVLDLHGDSNIGELTPLGKANENVFEIQQGVSVTIGVLRRGDEGVKEVRHGDIWGNRYEKYNELSLQSIAERKWRGLVPCSPGYYLFPFNDANLAEYQRFPSIADLMPVNSCGVKTHRDAVITDLDRTKLIARISDLATEQRLDVLRERYGITDTPHWRLKEAQAKIKNTTVSSFVHRLLYRPFDARWIYYNPAIIEKGDSKYPTLRHMLDSNLALLTARIQATGIFDAVFVSNCLVEMKTAESSRSCTVFPLYLKGNDNSLHGKKDTDSRVPNFDRKIILEMGKRFGLKGDLETDFPSGLSAKSVFQYIYSVFHSPRYRERYAAFLKMEFPRVPLPNSVGFLDDMARLGSELLGLHLLESPRLDRPITIYSGSSAPEVEKVNYDRGTVWLDKAQTRSFRDIPDAVWNFHIGGYQVCEKWLKDRKGRTLSKADIEHYQKIIVAISETIRIMAEIDKVIDQHGGWPGAFVTEPLKGATTQAKSEGKSEAKSESSSPADRPPRESEGESQLPFDAAISAGEDRSPQPPEPPMPDSGKASWTLKSQPVIQTKPLFQAPAKEEPNSSSAIDTIDESDIMAAIRASFPDSTPRDRDEVIRDVARELGFERAGARIRERLEGALKAAAHRRIVATERGEMYLLTRTIEDYTLDECVQFLLATMRSSGGPAVWDRDEAIKLTASYLGFRRTGSRVTAALKSAINAGIRRSQLARDQNSIRIA